MAPLDGGIETAAEAPACDQFCDDTEWILRYIKRAMTDQPDYTVRAIHADEQAERAVSPGLSDRWRAVARAIARWRVSRPR